MVRYVGVGVGLGGNVLVRHAMRYPERVISLVLVNTLCTSAGWIEWGYQKRNINHLKQHGITQVLSADSPKDDLSRTNNCVYFS